MVHLYFVKFLYKELLTGIVTATAECYCLAWQRQQAAPVLRRNLGKSALTVIFQPKYVFVLVFSHVNSFYNWLEKLVGRFPINQRKHGAFLTNQ